MKDTVNNSGNGEVITTTQAAQNDGFMSIIDKVALLPGMESVEKLERMMKMQLEWEKQQAEKSFSESMSNISRKLSGIKIVRSRSVAYDLDKNDKSKGKREAFKYAAIEDIDPIIRPLMDEEGIELSYDMQPLAAGWYAIEARATKGLYSRKASVPMPLDTSGGKNNAQGSGSTFTYGQRRALCALFNIVTVGMDDDASGGVIDDGQALYIKTLIKESGADTKAFLKYMKAASVEEILFKDYRRATSALEEKMNSKKTGENS